MQKHDLMIDFCRQMSKLSKCKDKQTAAILVSIDMMQIFSIGINGGPKGGQQCLCSDKVEINTYPEPTQIKKKYTCAHAEMNCLIKNKEFETEKIMISLKQPCQMCATLIVNAQANIKEVWYLDSYWDHTGIDILKAAGICVKQVEQYAMDRYCFIDECWKLPNKEK